MFTQHLAIIDALDEQIEIFSQEIKKELEAGPSVNLTSFLVSVYYMFKRKEAYQDLGYEYEDKRKRDTTIKRLVHRLEDFGFEVNLKGAAEETVTPTGVTVGN